MLIGMAYIHVSAPQIYKKFPRLSDLSSPPKDLFLSGSSDNTLFENCVAIVGSRRMTSYGKQVIEQIIPPLVLAKKTIISGFMYGVDQYAHKICIENGGKTIAVLGWGIAVALEDSDRQLADNIVTHGGALVSEWESQKAALWTFPARNRIVAALAKEVIVIEAAYKSGSLITAQIAKKLNRTLWAVPGPITSSTSRGTNALIAGGDAQLWSGNAQEKIAANSTDPVLSLLQTEPLTSDEIARKLGMPIAQIGAQLSLFAIAGNVIERDGKYSVV